MSNQTNKKNLTAPYAMVQGSYWMGFVVYGAFSSYYLLEAGLSNTAIGALLSLSALVSALLSPSVGALIDRSPRIKNREVIAAMSLLVALFSLIMYFVPINAMLATAIIFSLIYFVSQLLCPFINALGAEYMNAGYRLNFGAGRAGGSLGYAVFALVMGSLTVKFGTVCIPMVSFIAFSLLALIAWVMLPKLGTGAKVMNADGSAEGQKRSNASEGPIAFMKKYPVYMGFLGGMILIYFAHNFVNIFSLQILVEKGGNSQHVGIAAAIGACAEMIPMLTYDKWLSKRFSMTGLIRFAAVFFIIKEFLTLVVPTTTLYMFVMVLQALAWGVVAVVIVYYVNDIINLENASQGQAYAGMALTLGNVFCSFGCGLLLDLIGVNATIATATAICTIGAIIVWMTTQNK